MQNENFAAAAGHSANWRGETNVSYAQRRTWPAVNGYGCILAAAAECVCVSASHRYSHSNAQTKHDNN